jgi:type IV pilus assembly protein PilZ
MADEETTKMLEERRREPRHKIQLDVNYRHGENYLFSRSENLSLMGIFLCSDDPLPMGTVLNLRFTPPGGGEAINLEGRVVWVESPGTGRLAGMGIRFLNPTSTAKKRVKTLIRTMTYFE